MKKEYYIYATFMVFIIGLIIGSLNEPLYIFSYLISPIEVRHFTFVLMLVFTYWALETVAHKEYINLRTNSNIEEILDLRLKMMNTILIALPLTIGFGLWAYDKYKLEGFWGSILTYFASAGVLSFSGRLVAEIWTTFLIYEYYVKHVSSKNIMYKKNEQETLISGEKKKRKKRTKK